MNTNKQKLRRQIRVRANIHGTSEKPRLSVFRSNTSFYAQIIDDAKKQTLVGISEKHLENPEGTKSDVARLLGKSMAQKAIQKKIKQVIFDRGSYAYHGRVKAFAEGAREGGLKF